MAKYADGVNRSKALSPSSENVLAPGTFRGKLRVMQDYAVISDTTTLKSGEWLVVGGKLPTNSQVVDIYVEVPVAISDASPTNCYIRVGDQGDNDRYITSTIISTSTTNVDTVILDGPTVTTGMQYTVTGVTDNYIRLHNPGVASDGGENSWSSGTIKVSIFYVVE